MPEFGEMVGVVTVGLVLLTVTEELFALVDTPTESVTVAEQ